jgi:hypothetical protein
MLSKSLQRARSFNLLLRPKLLHPGFSLASLSVYTVKVRTRVVDLCQLDPNKLPIRGRIGHPRIF